MSIFSIVYIRVDLSESSESSLEENQYILKSDEHLITIFGIKHFQTKSALNKYL